MRFSRYRFRKVVLSISSRRRTARSLKQHRAVKYRLLLLLLLICKLQQVIHFFLTSIFTACGFVLPGHKKIINWYGRQWMSEILKKSTRYLPNWYPNCKFSGKNYIQWQQYMYGIWAPCRRPNWYQPNLLDVRQYPSSPRVETFYWRIIYSRLVSFAICSRYFTLMSFLYYYLI